MMSTIIFVILGSIFWLGMTGFMFTQWENSFSEHPFFGIIILTLFGIFGGVIWTIGLLEWVYRDIEDLSEITPEYIAATIVFMILARIISMAMLRRWPGLVH